MAWGFVYLGRDVLVRVFYALGDGITPFRVSMVSIFLNAVLAYVLYNFRRTGFSSGNRGEFGLDVLLFWLLDRKPTVCPGSIFAHLRLDWQLCGGSQLG